MPATLTPPPTRPAAILQPASTSPALLRPISTALAVFVGIAGIGLAIALVTGATIVFNILVFALFTVLWIAFAAALGFSPRTLDDLWHAVRALPLVVQALILLLFLPVAIGLWAWESSWSIPVRLIIVAGLAVANIYMFFPRTF